MAIRRSQQVTDVSTLRTGSGLAPIITGFEILGTDDTALDTAGGQTIVIKGKGFKTGATITAAGSSIGSVSFVDSTTLTFTSEAQSAGTYNLYVKNQDGGTAILAPGLIYSGLPTFSTGAGSLGSYYETTSINETVVAAEGEDTITYSLYSGSLPSGATLSSNGTITGTAPVDSSSTTYTFTIQATDEENQSATREFSLTINVDVITWSAPSEGSTELTVDSAMSTVTLSASSAAGDTISYTANTLPSNVTLSGSTVSGTPNTVQTLSTVFTATSGTTNRSATRTVTWVVNVAGDSYFKQTSLLLNADNNNITTDASINNVDVVPTIGTNSSRVSAFSPFNYQYSLYFDGTSYVVSDVTGSNWSDAFAFGTDDFTVEGWFCFTGTISTYQRPWAFGDNNDNIEISSSVLKFGGGSQGTLITGTTTIKSGVWYHIALVRNSGTYKLFLNGDQEGSSASNSYNSSARQFGLMAYPTGADKSTGYVSSFRIVRGTALYSNAFTPSDKPLTSVQGTVLLTGVSNNIRDFSADNPLTNSGSSANGIKTQVSSFSPFARYKLSPTDYSVRPWNISNEGGYITVPDNSAFDFGTNNFTIEMFVNMDIKTYDFHFFNALCSNGNYLVINSYNSAWRAGALGSYSIGTSTGLVAGRWLHLALVRDGDYFKYYVNGSLVGTSASISGVSFDVNGTVNIGRYYLGSTGCLAALSNLRITRGIAVYTGAFTPPTSRLGTTQSSGTNIAEISSSSSVVLLTLQDDDFVDNSDYGHTLTPVGKMRCIPVSPFDSQSFDLVSSDDTTGSAYFPGYTAQNVDVKYTASDPGIELSNQDITIECWVYNYGFYGAQYNRGIFTLGDGASLNSNKVLFRIVNGDQLNVYILQSGALKASFSALNLITIGEWHHVCLIRENLDWRCYVDGVYTNQSINTTDNTVYTNYDDCYIGYSTDGNDPHMYGYISNLRINKGVVYTDARSFYPSNNPLTNISNTKLLTLQNRTGYNNRVPIDDSGIKNQITNPSTSNAAVGSFSPFVPTGWSGYFDGSDYLGVASFPVFGTGDFTVEWWAYKDNTWLDAYDITDGGSGAFAIYAGTNGNFNVTKQSTPGAAKLLGNLSSLSPNQWYYFAIVRQSGNVRCYVDGQPLAAAVADTNSYAAATKLFGTADGYWPGYISNFRVFSSAIYDISSSSIAVPTAPFGPSAANGTAASLLLFTSPTFEDQSPSRLAITRYNDSKITPFSPFAPHTVAPDSYSYFHSATTDYLSVADDTNLQFETGEFTIEAWIYQNATSGTNTIATKGSSGGSGWLFRVASNALQMLVSGFGTNVYSLSSITPYTWHHVVVMRDSSNNLIMGIDGVLETVNTNVTYNMNQNNLLYIGTSRAPGTNSFPGYISNLRTVKGVAVYTGNFTPPSGPLAATQSSGTNIAAITGTSTSLLTSQSRDVVDNSTNEFAITVNGTVQPSKFNPFGETVTTGVEYSPVSHGGSVYFDGTADWLKTPSSSLFNWYSTDFTIEGWFYATAPASSEHIFSSYIDASNRENLYFSSSTQLNWYVNGANRISATGLTANQWYHVAVVSSGGTTTMYLNGAFVNTWASAYSNGNRLCWIGTYNDGGYAPDNFTGYISNFRIVSGTAIYTSAFVPPAAPTTPNPSTSLLINGTNAAIQDRTGRNVLETADHAKLINESPYSLNKSVYFDGTSAYLSCATDTAFDFGTGDATVEFWFNSPGTTLNYPGIISSVNYNTAGSASIRFDNTGYKGKIFMYLNSEGNPAISSSVLSYDTWYHVALVRTGTSLKLYINGVLDTSANISVSAGWNLGYGGLRIGRGFDVDTSNAYYKGYLSNIRLTKGVVVYTGNFDPPTAPLSTTQSAGTNIAAITSSSSVSLLACQSYNFKDNSTNNFTITNNNGSSISSRGPFTETTTYVSSMKFDGTGDYLVAPNDSWMNYGNSNFTIECWVYFNSLSTQIIVSSNYNASTGAGGWAFVYRGDNTTLLFTCGGNVVYARTWAPSIGQWYFVSVTRSGTDLKLFVNGTQLGATFTSSDNIGSSTTLVVGNNSAGATFPFNGYIDDLRITKGVARTIDVPTSTFNVK